MSATPATTQRAANRRRSSSVTTALKQVPLNRQESREPVASSEVKPLDGPIKPRKVDGYALPANYKSLGLWGDIRTGRWLVVPSSAFKIMLIPLLINFTHWALIRAQVIPASTPNPVGRMLWLSGKQPDGLYRKHLGDFAFVAWHVVVWSFVRQFMTIHVLRPLGKWLGVPGSKAMRFTEQGYAVFYFGMTGPYGIYVMRSLPTWWYKTEQFWINYPYREISFELKLFYLLQGAYWTQQSVILGMQVEAPRKDFKELVGHHFVTLYLIFWSYITHFTYIGVAIFVTMDISDIFLALSKCVNYFNEPASQPLFAFFILVWTYFRHYLNILILWSVWYEFDLIPEKERTYFRPWEDMWCAPWLRKMIFLPIFLLQAINLFWYFLIWRILIRTIVTGGVKDERSDGEDEEEEEQVKAVGTESSKTK